MVHGPGSKCFMLCIYCLVTNKTEWILRRAGEGPLLMEEAAHAGGGALLLTKDALHVVKAHALLVGMKGVLVVGRLLRVEDALSVL
ncbi:hypothetical protein PF005_g7696 [Phytophthora fragariae]|uniref:Uncharacterized protein n=1 Tax=Phytophthora fragariae TaxID=53985 RepID=A0A6A3FAP1_9STRA|nr:hypothetical protein PF003_g36378 [Phytophthora fragariae]KAE8941676.1 hypothetical protein PF009_g8552 [Phytophthora fragariae]KAE9180959.1 hypothetical protein PF004_g24691 [Phytophthora fragariae]KAE9219903.1 hypothetical protein PF005_g7696 [Phytophthora fragariae]